MNFKYFFILTASIALNVYLISEIVYKDWIAAERMEAQKEMFYLMKNLAEKEKEINLQVLNDEGVEENIKLILDENE